MTTKVIVLGSPLFASLRFEIEIRPGGNETKYPVRISAFGDVKNRDLFQDKLCHWGMQQDHIPIFTRGRGRTNRTEAKIASFGIDGIFTLAMGLLGLDKMVSGNCGSLRREAEFQALKKMNKDLLDEVYLMSIYNELRPEAKKFNLCRKLYLEYLSNSSDLIFTR